MFAVFHINHCKYFYSCEVGAPPTQQPFLLSPFCYEGDKIVIHNFIFLQICLRNLGTSSFLLDKLNFHCLWFLILSLLIRFEVCANSIL
jgi:hypothetical protein